MIVVFGATGFTGRLATAALVERGVRPVVAGRHADALESLAAEHGGLDSAVADVDDPRSVRALVGEGDVLVTTVGPFSVRGEAALDAAIDAGAHYVDSTGEANFIRHVVRDAGPRAERSGSALLTAFGYDYVPGHVAAALALEAAGPAARRLRVVYSGLGSSGISSGARASALRMIAEHAHMLRDGRLVERPTGRDVTGTTMLVGGTEPLVAPRQWPGLTDVSVWLDIGPTAWFAKAVSYLVPAVMRLPPVRDRARRAGGPTGTGPSAEDRAGSPCTVSAVASDADGTELGRGQVHGPNPYDLTAVTLAAAAVVLSSRGAPRAGALGPLELFGHLPVAEAAAELGLTPAIGSRENG